MTNRRRVVQDIVTIIFTVCLLSSIVLLSSCWDDSCPEGCDPGYACYYGVCLSRGWCPSDDPFADTCAKYDSHGTCTQRVDHGICQDGYVCVCEVFDPETGQCDPGSRSCQPQSD